MEGRAQIVTASGSRQAFLPGQGESLSCIVHTGCRLEEPGANFSVASALGL